MRASQLFIPTLREDPGDAEAASHKLLVRGGFIRQLTTGLWTFMPLGWRVHRKVEQIIREEMDAIGSQEMSGPVLTPAELWKQTGRYGSTEIFKFKDRNGRDFILPLTHGRRSRTTRRRSRATGSCRSSGTTSRRRIVTNRARVAGCSVCASSS